MDVTHANRELALLRLVAQGVVGPRRSSPQQSVERLLCLQAQDYWSGVASLAVRSAASSAEVVATFDARTIVRAWPLRGTLHLVAANDLAWLRALLAPRELARAKKREAGLGITRALLAKAQRCAVELLSSLGPCSRAEVTDAWNSRGIDTTNERGYQLIWHLAQSGVLCFGPVRHGQQLLVLADSWVPTSSEQDRDSALENLARRYFVGHGPATPHDLARWANLTVRDSKRALNAARGHLTSIMINEIEYFLGPTTLDDLALCREEANEVIALPGFDELIFGYRDRTPTLPDHRSAAVFPNRNGVPSSTIIVAGQVVATWTRSARTSRTDIEINPLEPLSQKVIDAAQRQASALARR